MNKLDEFDIRPEKKANFSFVRSFSSYQDRMTSSDTFKSTRREARRIARVTPVHASSSSQMNNHEVGQTPLLYPPPYASFFPIPPVYTQIRQPPTHFCTIPYSEVVSQNHVSPPKQEGLKAESISPANSGANTTTKINFMSPRKGLRQLACNPFEPVSPSSSMTNLFKESATKRKPKSESVKQVDQKFVPTEYFRSEWKKMKKLPKNEGPRSLFPTTEEIKKMVLEED
jgi:hypothetical protein